MTAYVRVRKHDDLVARIDDTGTQVDVAFASGLTVPRINQLYTGTHLIVEVRKARALEDAVGVPHGELFEAVDAELLAPYLRAIQMDSDADGDTDSDTETDPGSDPGGAATGGAVNVSAA